LVRKPSFEQVSEVLVVVVIVATQIVLLSPIVSSLIMSFDSREYLGYWPPSGFSTKWYQRFFANDMFVTGLQTSLLLATMTSALSIVIGILASYGLVRYNFRGKEGLNTLLLSPLIAPGIVLGYALLGFFSLIGFRLTFSRLLVAHIIITLPYVIRAISATLIGFERSLEEAAQNLGANPVTTFFKITFPLIKPGVTAAAVFSFAASLDDVSVSIFLVDTFTSTLPVNLFSNMKAQFDLSLAAASGILMAFTLIIMLIIEKVTGLDEFVGLGAIQAGR
jgi:putative spermidine/putrescine transport system permease protein